MSLSEGDEHTLEHYRIVRGEVIEAERLNYQILVALIGALGATGAAGIAAGSLLSPQLVSNISPEFIGGFLGLSLIAAANALLNYNRSRILRAGTYLRVFLEEGGQTSIRWEHRLHLLHRLHKLPSGDRWRTNKVSSSAAIHESYLMMVLTIAFVLLGLMPWLRALPNCVCPSCRDVIILVVGAYVFAKSLIQRNSMNRRSGRRRLEDDFEKAWEHIRKNLDASKRL